MRASFYFLLTLCFKWLQQNGRHRDLNPTRSYYVRRLTILDMKKICHWRRGIEYTDICWPNCVNPFIIYLKDNLVALFYVHPCCGLNNITCDSNGSNNNLTIVDNFDLMSCDR